ncbi:MAG: glycosyltransferase [Bacteroidota bacterium]
MIVAARNEEKYIGRCLQSLVTQEYPAGLFEIIIINDRSTDKTAAIVENYCARYASVTLVNVTSVTSDLPPKKNALNEGIRKSKNDILVFTDADCVPPPTWLGAIAREFTFDVGAVAGYSPIQQRFPSQFIARWGDFFLRYLEIKKSVGAAAGIGLGRAFMCTGRNLAYRKSVFHEVRGYEQIRHSISGDDDLFIQLVQDETQWKIRYMLVPESYVPTNAPASVGAFINQHKRHFSAGKFYPMRMKIIFALMHSFSALAFLSIFVSPAAGVLLLSGKLFVDGWIFYRGTALFGESRLRRSLLPLECASVVYNSFIGPLGVLGTFTWKGRRS